LTPGILWPNGRYPTPDAIVGPQRRRDAATLVTVADELD
jgi:hypothetical protein